MRYVWATVLSLVAGAVLLVLGVLVLPPIPGGFIVIALWVVASVTIFKRMGPRPRARMANQLTHKPVATAELDETPLEQSSTPAPEPPNPTSVGLPQEAPRSVAVTKAVRHVDWSRIASSPNLRKAAWVCAGVALLFIPVIRELVAAAAVLVGLWLLARWRLSVHHGTARNASAASEVWQGQSQPTRPVIVCPRCGSDQVQAFKKGFSLGKAILGGPLLGTWGMNAVEIVCLRCGKKWRPGRR